ncbi:bile acid:Na+ symporter, BASS family [Bacteroidales bacterium WCE2004]|nr:bile acid:Na+ symporter, BASS family [Bacteroidales bacterium WCE2004]
MNTIWIVLPILTVLMFDLGLCLKLQDFARVVKAPKAVLLALFGQIVLLPLIALGIGRAFGLTPVFFLGLILIACCPGGSSSNIFSKLAGGDVALSVTLTALSSLITLVTVPLVMAWATEAAGAAVGITLPVGNLLKQNLLLMLLPVLLGIGVNHFRPKAAAAIDRVLSKAAFPALMVLISVFFLQHYRTIFANMATLGLCVTLLIVLSAGSAAGLSRLFRLGGQQRRTTVIEVGMQNAAQAIAVATSPFIFNNPEMAIPAILYSLMMNVVLLIYVGLVRRRKA